MKRLSGVRPIALGTIIVFVLVACVIATALSGRLVKASLEKVSDRLRVEKISFGWGTVQGHEVRILDSGREIARAKFVAVRPSLATFFRKGYTLSRITIEEPSLALTITKDNHVATPFPHGTSGEKQETAVIHIGSLEIRNGILSVNDQRSGAPAQLQVFNVDLSIDSFSYPLEDKQSTLRVSGQLSGKVLSGRISSSGAVNLKTGALGLVCAAEGLNALQYGSKKPHIHIERLSFLAESTGSLPLSIKDVRIINGYYRYSSDQKRQIAEAVPGTASGDRPKRALPTRPIALIKGITLKNGEFVIEGSAGQRATPEMSVVDVTLSIDQIPLPFDNTPSSFDLSGHIPGRQSMASLRWSGTTAFGTLETESQLSLRSLDLTILRPYLEKQGDALVAGGTVDIQARPKLHDRYVNTPVRATIRHLELAPARGLRDQFMGVPRSFLLNSLKTRNNEIQIDFLVSGPIDSPSFSLQEDMTKRFAFALAKALGLSAVGAGETVIEQGARAVQGAGKGIEGLGEGIKRLFGQ